MTLSRVMPTMTVALLFACGGDTTNITINPGATSTVTATSASDAGTSVGTNGGAEPSGVGAGGHGGSGAAEPVGTGGGGEAPGVGGGGAEPTGVGGTGGEAGAGGVGGACAAAETCNGLDDDCDGAIDEELAVGTMLHTASGGRPSMARLGPSHFAIGYTVFDGAAGRFTYLQVIDDGGMPAGEPTLVTAEGGTPHVLWNGTYLGVFWAENYYGSGVYYRLFGADGLAATDVLQISDANSQATLGAAVAPDGSFLIAFEDYTGVGSEAFSIASVASDGASSVVVVPELRTQVRGRVIWPRLTPTFDGLSFRLFWGESETNSSPYTLYARAVGPDGMPSGDQVTIMADADLQELGGGTATSDGFAFGAYSMETNLGAVFVIDGEDNQTARLDLAHRALPWVSRSADGLLLLNTGRRVERRDEILQLNSGFDFSDAGSDQETQFAFAAAEEGLNLVATSVHLGEGERETTYAVVGPNICDAP